LSLSYYVSCVGQIESFIEYRHITSYSLTVLYLKMSKSKEDEAGESPTGQGIDSENAIFYV